MARALIISSNELTNDILEANYKAFLGTDIFIYDSFATARVALELEDSFDLVVVVGDGELAEQGPNVVDFIAKRNPDLKIIALGFEEKIAGTIELKDRYDIKKLMQSSASILGVTAKDMVEKQVSDFFPIPIGLGIAVTKAPCMVYGHFETGIAKLVDEGEQLGKKAKELKSQGHKVLYVTAGDRLKFVMQSSQAIISKLSDKKAPVEEVFETISEGQDIVGLHFSDNESATEEIVEISRACVDALKTTVSKVPSLKALIQSLMENKQNYIYFHGVMTNYICKHIIDNISWGAKEQYEKISFVLFFHDMFLVPVFNKYPHFRNEEDPLYDESIEDSEKEIVLQHAKMAAEIIGTFPQIPIGADTICLQHHGEKNGMGLPSSYKDDISPLSKVIIVAESLVEILLADYNFEGPIHFDKQHCLKKLGEKYKRVSYRKIVETLVNLEV